MSKKNNLFRVMTALFCVIMVITSMPIGVQASILGNEMNEGADISDFEEKQEIKENVDSSIFFVSEPSYTQQENKNGISTQKIGVKEDTDRNLSMDSFSNSNIGYDADSGNLKKLFDRGTILNYANAAFAAPFSLYMQGSCSDGTYYYFAFYARRNLNNEITTVGTMVVTACMNANGGFDIVKVRTSAENEALINIEHANCLTFNPNNEGAADDQIVIATTNNDKSQVSVVNADYFRGANDSLSIKKNIQIGCRFTTIAYCKETNRYVVNISGNHNCFCVLDSDFNIIETHIKTGSNRDNSGGTQKLGHQGLYCDSNYIYSLFCYTKNINASENEKEYQNVMGIYKWDGTLVKEINLNFASVSHYGYSDIYEGEGLIFSGNKVLMPMNCIYSTGDSRRIHYYYYDLSQYFYSIQYCIDTNVQAHINDTNKIYSYVLYDQATPLKKNTFVNPGYKFVGWYGYRPDEDTWLYKNGLGDDCWCKEGGQPDGYYKQVYKDKASVKRTIPAGRSAMLCACWEATDKFTVKFDNNKGSGTMSDKTVTFGTSTKMPVSKMTKSGCEFLGWYVFNPQTDEWIYESSDGTKTEWKKEGKQTKGYLKKAYKNETTIARTVAAGQNVVFFAKWNEYYVMFNTGNKAAKIDEIISPFRAIYNTSKTLPYYKITNSKNVTQTSNTYHLYRPDKGTWKYTNGTTNKWYTRSNQPSGYSLFKHQGKTVKTTVPIGERVVCVAQW